MKQRITHILWLCLTLLSPLPAYAEGGDSLQMANPTRHVTRATLYGAGFTNVYDTYLSPQEYKGVDFRIARESSRMTSWLGGNVMQQTFFQADLGYTHNRVDNNDTFSSLFNWNWALHYRFCLTPNFTLTAGALGDMNGGFVYNLRNGNNPAQARAYVSLDATGMAIWKLRIGQTTLTLRYQLSLPLAGVQFMPGYGQSYYEIFSLGHGKGVVHFTSLHNQPSLRQMLTADLPVGKLKMRFAYLADLQQGKLNHIKWHTYSHVFMAGVVKEFYLIK